MALRLVVLIEQDELGANRSAGEQRLGHEERPAERRAVILELADAEGDRRNPTRVANQDRFLARQPFQLLQSTLALFGTAARFCCFCAQVRELFVFLALDDLLHLVAHFEEEAHDRRRKRQAVGRAHQWVFDEGRTQRHLRLFPISGKQQARRVVEARTLTHRRIPDGHGYVGSE